MTDAQVVITTLVAGSTVVSVACIAIAFHTPQGLRDKIARLVSDEDEVSRKGHRHEP